MIRALAMMLAGLISYLLLQAATPPVEVGLITKPTGYAGSAERLILPRMYYGLAIQVDSAYQPVARYGALIREIADLGANTVLFSVNGYQDNAGSTTIQIDPQRTPTDEQWRDLFGIARQQGLHIIVMPKILLTQPRGSEWRGVIDPGGNWDEWFQGYQGFILHFARLADDCGVDVFIVGSELVSAEKHTRRWKELIGQVREAFPRGMLTYSANWDHYDSIRFWEELDLIALTSYYKTGDRVNPPLPTLLSSWQSHRDAIVRWQKTVDKPLLFTEAGWCSQEGCSIEPWNYYRQQESSAIGLEEQRRNYEAFIRTWQDCSAVAGVMWWEWTPGPGGVTDFGYTPKNKPAQVVLTDWFDNLRKFRKNGRLTASE